MGGYWIRLVNLFVYKWMNAQTLWASKMIVGPEEILNIKGLFRDCYTLYFVHAEISQNLLRVVQCCTCFSKHCCASTIFIYHIPLRIMRYLHLYLQNALNANCFWIKISCREIYMINCGCNAQKIRQNLDFQG